MEIQIKYFIETLNRENGGATFEKIASGLAEKEICSNILPSTGPYGGGDKGTDARTYETYLTESADIFRLYQSTNKSPTKLKIYFAFSIEKGWKSKFKNDAKKIIVTYDLKPEKICFITNQFIKSAKREEFLKELIALYPGLKFEIFDGEWVTKKLAGDHYNLLVQCGVFPEQRDPNIEQLYARIYSFRDGGMTDAESVKVKDLIQKTSLRSSYEGILEQRVIDLITIADIQVKYTQFIEKSVKFYEEALSDVKEVRDKALVVDIYYSYFVALQKLRLYKRISEKLPEFSEYIFSNSLAQYVRYIFTWLMYLLPHQAEVNGFDLKQFAQINLSQAMELDRSGKPKHVLALLDEAVVYGKQLLTMIGIRNDSIIELWKSHIESVKDIPLYPLQSLSKLVSALAIPFEGTPEYEDLYHYAEKILLDRDQKLDAAQFRKDRAMNLYQAGRYADAIHHLNIVKLEWYAHETIRGSMLSSFALQSCYSKLKLHYGSIQELFTVLHLSTSDEDTFARHRDLFVQALSQLHFEYVQLGLWGSAIITAKLTISAIRKYGIEPSLSENEKSFEETFNHNMSLLLGEISSQNPDLSKKLVGIIEETGLSCVTTYKMMFEESDEEFKKGWDGEEEKYKEALKLREKLQKGEYKFLEESGLTNSIDESTSNQRRQVEYEGVTVELNFQNTYEAKIISEHILSFLEMILVELLNTAEFVWIERKININLFIEDLDQDFQIREKPDNDCVAFDLVIDSYKANEFYGQPYEVTFEVEVHLFSYILNQCTIDKSEYVNEVIDELAKNGFFGSLRGRLPLGAPFKTFFSKEEYEKLIS